MTPTIVVTAFALTGYALACWIFPFGPCRVCSGAGTRTAFLTHRDRPCRWCRGSGRRLRLGRRIFNYAAAVHHGATDRRRTREGSPR